jgi:gliding motility-associated-like protein
LSIEILLTDRFESILMKSLLRLVPILLLFCCCTLAWAQPDCPCVNADKNDGCVPYSISVTNCSAVNNTSIVYNFGERGTYEPFGTTTYTYNNVGDFNFRQRGNFTCGGTPVIMESNPVPIKVRAIPAPNLISSPCAEKSAFITSVSTQYDEYYVVNGNVEIKLPATVTFADTLLKTLVTKGRYAGLNCGGDGQITVESFDLLKKPRISEIRVVGGNQISISFSPDKLHIYEVQMKTGLNGTFAIVDTLFSSATTYTQSGLNTNQPYYFRFRAFDACGHSVMSEEFGTTVLSATAANEQNQLVWIDYPNLPAASFSLIKNNVADNAFANRPNRLTYTDTDIACGGQYCYQIQMTLAEGIKSFSNTVCVNAISTTKPAALADVQSTVLGEFAQISWPMPSASVQAFSVYGSKGGGAYSALGTTSGASFLDVKNSAAFTHNCYKVSFQDKCGNTTDFSNVTCPVFLSGQVIDVSTRVLTWQAYIGWAEGVKEYKVERLDEAGNVYASIDVALQPNYMDNLLDTNQQFIRFRIRAISNTGRQTVSNVWEVRQQSSLHLPNAFTPNDDGLNDVFLPVGLFIQECKLEIWNRHGEGVFATTSFKEGWDGKIKGKNAPVDTYMYSLEAKDKFGKAYSKTGSIQLIR